MNDNIAQNPEDRLFREYIMKGDDFCKIEIYYQAVNWYRKAVELRPDSEEARQRLDDCTSKKKAESKTIIIILITAAAIIGVLTLILR